MASKYNKKHNVIRFSEGDAVSIRIPRIDRTSSDLPRLPCVVVEVTHNIYRLRYGSLNLLFRLLFKYVFVMFIGSGLSMVC